MTGLMTAVEALERIGAAAAGAASESDQGRMLAAIAADSERVLAAISEQPGKGPYHAQRGLPDPPLVRRERCGFSVYSAPEFADIKCDLPVGHGGKHRPSKPDPHALSGPTQ